MAQTSAVSVPTPPVGKATIFLDSADGMFKAKFPDNSIVTLSVTDEYIADLVGNLIVSSTSITANYDDPNDVLTFNVLYGTPITQNPDQTNTAGVSNTAARSDHTHNIPTATAVGLNANSTNTQGSSTSFSRADHTHDLSTGAVSTQTPDQTNAEGTSANLARADHIHNIPTGVPSTIGTANAQGTANAFARQDHIHNHGAQTDPTHHAAVTTTNNGFMSAADKVILDRLRTGFLQYRNSAAAINNTVTYANLALDADIDSFANGFFTKVSATEYRVDFTGRIRLSYSVTITEAGNNRGSFVRVARNGVGITNTERQTTGSSASAASTAAITIILEVTSGDLFTLQFRSGIAGNTATVPIARASMLMEIYTLGLT
jgi:hypothetical protein